MIGRKMCDAHEAEDADRSCHSVTRVCVNPAFILYLHASPLHHSAAQGQEFPAMPGLAGRQFFRSALIGEFLRGSTCRICTISRFVRIPTHEIQRRSKTHSTVGLLDTAALGATKGSAFPASFLSHSSPLPCLASPQQQITSLVCAHLGSRFFLIISVLSGCSTIYTAPLLLP